VTLLPKIIEPPPSLTSLAGSAPDRGQTKQFQTTRRRAKQTFLRCLKNFVSLIASETTVYFYFSKCQRLIIASNGCMCNFWVFTEQPQRLARNILGRWMFWPSLFLLCHALSRFCAVHLLLRIQALLSVDEVRSAGNKCQWTRFGNRSQHSLR